MDFKLKNFGKIAEADIKLDGITVICGDNNTGKSTVGKALFSFYNSLCDYKTKINMQKYSKFRSFILANTNGSMPMDLSIGMLDSNNPISFISSQNGNFTIEKVKNYIESNYSIKVSKSKTSSLVEYLNLPESDILNEYIFRYYSLIMNNQIKKLVNN